MSYAVLCNKRYNVQKNSSTFLLIIKINYYMLFKYYFSYYPRIHLNSLNRDLSSKRKIIGRFQVTPLVLFRIGTTKQVYLREYQDQKSKGKYSYDFTLRENGLILPATGDEYIGPNGMSLRPNGNNSCNWFENKLL